MEFPSSPCTIPAGAGFIWPFGLELAPGVHLDHASAQLLCHLDEGCRRTVFFAATPGVPSEFAFNGAAPFTLAPGRRIARVIAGKNGAELRVVLLDDADSLSLWKAEWRGRARVFLSSCGLVADGSALRLSADTPDGLSVLAHPAPDAPAGVLFYPLPLEIADRPSAQTPVAFRSLRPAGPPRVIPFGWTTPAVAVAPTDADFASAAAWRIELPAAVDFAAAPLLRIRYVGDVARVRIGDRLVLDDFYNGDELELDLSRHAEELSASANINVEILPLTPDAPILLPENTRPETTTAWLGSVVLVSAYVAVVP